MNSFRRSHLVILSLALVLSSCVSYVPKTTYAGARLGCEPRQCLTELAAAGVDSLVVTTIAPMATHSSELARLASEPVIIVSPGTPRFELKGDRIVSRFVGKTPPYTEELETVETRSELFAILSKIVSNKYVVHGNREEFQIDLTRTLSDQDFAVASNNRSWTLTGRNGQRIEHVRLSFTNGRLAQIEQANWRDSYPEL